MSSSISASGGKGTFSGSSASLDAAPGGPAGCMQLLSIDRIGRRSVAMGRNGLSRGT